MVQASFRWGKDSTIFPRCKGKGAGKGDEKEQGVKK